MLRRINNDMEWNMKDGYVFPFLSHFIIISGGYTVTQHLPFLPPSLLPPSLSPITSLDW